MINTDIIEANKGATAVKSVYSAEFQTTAWPCDARDEVCRHDKTEQNAYIDIQRCVSQTQQNFIMFIIVLGQHVSILIESFSGLSKIQILT